MTGVGRLVGDENREVMEDPDSVRLSLQALVRHYC